MSSYNFELTNGRTININDGTVDTSNVPTAIPGRGSFNWGVYVDQGILHTIENFYNTTSPNSPMEGQLFYKQPVLGNAPNIVDDTLQVCVQNKSDPQWGSDSYDKYKYVTCMYKESVIPTSLPQWNTYSHIALGDLWFNQANSTMFMYTTSGWLQLIDENSGNILFSLITDDNTNQTVTIVNNSIFSSTGLTTPSIKLTATNPVITGIVDAANATISNDNTIPTTAYVNSKLGISQNEILYISSNYLLNSSVYSPTMPDFINGKMLAFKNISTSTLTITCNNSFTIDGSNSILIGPQEAKWLGSYNNQWAIL